MQRGGEGGWEVRCGECPAEGEDGGTEVRKV